MKNKVLSLLLCGVIACSMLTACGNSNDSAESGVESTVETVKEDITAEATQSVEELESSDLTVEKQGDSDDAKVAYRTEDGMFSTDCWQTVDNIMYKLEGDVLMIGDKTYEGITLGEAREIHQLQRNIIHTSSNHEEFEAKGIFMRRCKEIAEIHKNGDAMAAEASQESQTSQVVSTGDHDYSISVDYIDSLDFGDDGYFALRATTNLWDDYTRDPSSSPDNIYAIVSGDCKFIYYGETLSDANEFTGKLAEEYLALKEKRQNNLDTGDVGSLNVVIDAGTIVYMGVSE